MCIRDSTQTSPEGAAQALTIGAHFVGNEPVCMVTGDCIIEGEGVTEKLRKALRAAKNSGQADVYKRQL